MEPHYHTISVGHELELIHCEGNCPPYVASNPRESAKEAKAAKVVREIHQIATFVVSISTICPNCGNIDLGSEVLIECTNRYLSNKPVNLTSLEEDQGSQKMRRVKSGLF